jgi:glycosyltransferase involved in cell wall biosynthesis
MACGCPVMVSNTSSMPEVCGDAALYFNPADKHAITSSIEKLISDKIIRDELREKGLIQSKKFSWEQTAKTLKTLIDQQFKFTHLKN